MVNSPPAVSASPRTGLIDGGSEVTVCFAHPDTAPILVAANRTICALYSAGVGDGQLIYGVRPAFTFGSASRNFSASGLKNRSCAACVLPPVIVPGPCEIALGIMSDETAGGNISWSAGTRVAYYDPVEASFSMRPYIDESNGSLLLAPHFSMVKYSTFDVTLHLPFARADAQVYRWKDLNASNREHSLSFSLGGLPPTVNQDCRVVVSFANGGPTLERLRRLQRAPQLPANSTVLPVQVDHATRSLRIDGRVWRGIGYYMADFGNGGYFWGFDGLDDLALRGLAPHGINQAMLYLAPLNSAIRLPLFVFGAALFYAQVPWCAGTTFNTTQCTYNAHSSTEQHLLGSK